MPRVTPQLHGLWQLRAILRLNIGLTVYQAIQDAIAEHDIDSSDKDGTDDAETCKRNTINIVKALIPFLVSQTTACTL